MAKKKTTSKAAPVKKAEVKKVETKKFDTGSANPEKDFKVGNTVTINNERYIVKKGNKLENKITGKVETY